MSEEKKPKGHLEEDEALAQAAENGIEFTDFWTIEGELDDMGVLREFSSKEEAEEVAGDRPVIQNRKQKVPEVENA